MSKDIFKAAIGGEVLKGVFIVDAHSHLGPWCAFHIPEFGRLEAMLEVMDRCGIDIACIAPHVGIGPDAKWANRITAEVMQRYPERIWGHICFDPNLPRDEMEGELKRCFEIYGMRGIKIHPDTHNYPLDGPGYEPAFEFAARNGLYILSHTWDGSPFSDPMKVATVAERFPEVPILMGHSGGSPRGYEKSLEVARKHKNAFLEICGSEYSGVWMERLVKRAGAERIVFGTDMPFHDPRFQLGRVALSKISDEEKRLILGGNIQRIYEGRWR